MTCKNCSDLCAPLYWYTRARPKRCSTLSNPVPWQNWMAAYPGYTLQMQTLFPGWPVTVYDTHTRRRRLRQQMITHSLTNQPDVDQLRWSRAQCVRRVTTKTNRHHPWSLIYCYLEYGKNVSRIIRVLAKPKMLRKEFSDSLLTHTWWWSVRCSSCSRSTCSMDTDTATQYHNALCHCRQ